jgi:hypothetical protein
MQCLKCGEDDVALDFITVWADRLEDPVVNALTDAEENLWLRLMHIANAHGRLRGDPVLLSRAAYPRRRQTALVVGRMTERLVNLGLLIPYERDGVGYLSFPPKSWEKRQRFGHRRRNSEYPAPTDGEIALAKQCKEAAERDLSQPFQTFLPLSGGKVRVGKVRVEEGRGGEVLGGEPEQVAKDDLPPNLQAIWSILQGIDGWPQDPKKATTVLQRGLSLYPKVDQEAQARRLLGYLEGHSLLPVTGRPWVRWMNWLNNADKFAREESRGRVQGDDKAGQRRNLPAAAGSYGSPGRVAL